MAEVTWVPQAIRHVQEIVEYVARGAPSRAGVLAERLLSAPEKLTELPRLGRVVPEIGQDHVRELVTVRPYRILYIIHEEACYVVAVIHSKRDLMKALRGTDFN